jgi:hypothetical protein
MKLNMPARRDRFRNLGAAERPFMNLTAVFPRLLVSGRQTKGTT